MATAIPKACLASSAIRCRDGETGPNLGVLAVFPSNGATCRCPLGFVNLPDAGRVAGQDPNLGGCSRSTRHHVPFGERSGAERAVMSGS